MTKFIPVKERARPISGYGVVLDVLLKDKNGDTFEGEYMDGRFYIPAVPTRADQKNITHWALR